MALAQGNSQNPAQPLSQAPTASLYPGQITSSLLPAKGGWGLVHMPTQVQTLQAFFFCFLFFWVTGKMSTLC